MKLHSCQNCWFNGLQYGALGLPVGYCSRHKKILNVADGTTCGLHVRKDLSIFRAKEVANIHAKKYSPAIIVRIINEEEIEKDTSSSEKDLNFLRKDWVAEAVSDFGILGSKIESLAQLQAMRSVRAEVAMMSLARAYISNCMQRKGRWTAGLHLYWWTKSRLSEIPEIAVDDLRTVGGIQLARQTALTAWSVIMLRLTLIDDIIEYAREENDAIGTETGLLDRAAESVETFSLQTLSRWLKSEAIPALDAQLPYRRYMELSQELHTATLWESSFG